ncbi:GntR family transcriptional regulator [Kocuria sp. UBA1838]|uniref:GntR family transcriptional regulator n=1 Tax=Kocuria sp. UBA1838 TaxID=1946673 RepID=UPI0039C98B29
MTSFHDRSSSSEDIARELTRDVTSRATGMRLPSHRALVTRFGASASPVSRARALLAQRGLVVSRPGAGRGREDVLVVGRRTGRPVHRDASSGRSLARLQTALTQRRRLAVRTVVETLGADVLPDHPPRGLSPVAAPSPGHRRERVPLGSPRARHRAGPGTYFHTDQPDVPRVRLSYAAAPTTADLVTGIHRLEGLVRGGPLQHRGPVSGCGACDGPRGARALGPRPRPAP